MGDLAAQYRFVRPWFTFPPEMTGGSSIMPQKLNPTGINGTRAQASAVLGNVVSYMFAAHKSTSGDTDLTAAGPNEALQGTAALLDGIAEMFRVFRFDEQRALEESLDDYGTATELANALQRLGGVPFRDAHHLAAVVVPVLEVVWDATRHAIPKRECRERSRRHAALDRLRTRQRGDGPDAVAGGGGSQPDVAPR